MRRGLRDYLNVPEHISIYLDNGAFYFASKGGEPTPEEYDSFVEAAKPDWQPIRFDAIPSPKMPWQTQLACYRHTMKINHSYQHDGYVPVVHAGRYLDRYLKDIQSHSKLSTKAYIALGGLIPNLLRSPKAAAYSSILDDLIHIRRRFPDKSIHVFGIGGTATLHLAMLLGFDSADSSGWRNRAARGMIQLPGSGERIVAHLGKWRGRKTSEKEWEILAHCVCPACQEFGVEGLQANGIAGFSNRATHNLWILLQEARWVNEHLVENSYQRDYLERLDNTIYLPLIGKILNRCLEGDPFRYR